MATQRGTRGTGQSPLHTESVDETKRGKAARTIAQTFCTVAGLTLIAVGILGFVIGATSFETGDAIEREELIAFDVNGWHNIVHLATGAFLLLMASKARTAITGALIFGVTYTAVTIWGFLTDDDILGLIPINSADNLLHLALAATALLVWALSGGMRASANGSAKR